MAKGYLALAEKLQTSNPDEAAAALVRVERLSTDAALRAHARSLRDTLTATKRLQNGVLDTSLLQSAVDTDKSNRRASQMLTSLDKNLVESTTNRMRWMTSGAIGLVSFIAIALILFRRRPRPDPAPTQSEIRPNDSKASAAEKHESLVPESTSPNVSSLVTATSDEAPLAGAEPAITVESSASTSPQKRDPFEGL
jgi:hypothetical protein